MKDHTFVGFGFGPIQAGFFVPEAVRSGTFSRIVIAEVDEQLVNAVRENNGSYSINIAHKDGIEVVKIDNIEVLNSTVASDRELLQQALTDAMTWVYRKANSARIQELIDKESTSGLTDDERQEFRNLLQQKAS